MLARNAASKVELGQQQVTRAREGKDRSVHTSGAHGLRAV